MYFMSDIETAEFGRFGSVRRPRREKRILRAAALGGLVGGGLLGAHVIRSAGGSRGMQALGAIEGASKLATLSSLGAYGGIALARRSGGKKKRRRRF